MADASRDSNFVPTLLGVSNVDGTTPVKVYADPTTHRLLIDSAGGGTGTVTSVSVVSANGLAGTVATATTTPAITLSTTITGILKGNGTAISAGAAGDVDTILPTQTAQSGKFLTTDGSNSSWGTPSGSGTVNAGTAGQLAYYAASAAAVSGNANITISSSAVTLGVAGSAVGTLKFANATSGTITLSPPTGALSGTLSLPIATDTLVGKATTDTFTNKTYDTAGTGNSFSINGVAVTANTGTGAVARAAGPTFTTPTLGAATATTINGNTFTTGTYTLTGQAGKTLTFNGSITLTGTDAQTYTFPTTTATIARTDAGQTFTGVQNFTSPDTTTSITTSTTSFTAWAGATTLLTIGGTGASASLFAPSTLDTSSSVTGAIRTSGGISAAKALNIGTTITGGGNLTIGTSNSATVGTIELGAATDTTLSRSSAGVLAVEGVVIPSISSTNTLTNKRVSRRVVTTTQSATPTINTDNTDVAAITGLAQAVTSFTTNLSGTPVAGDFLEIQVTDDGTARALTFGTSFAASTVALPTTTVISTLLHILFEWNTATSKWVCVAVA